MSVIDSILDKADEQEIKKLNVIVDKIDALEDGMKNLSDEELKDMTAIFKKNLKRWNFRWYTSRSLCCSKRSIKKKIRMRQYRVQLIGGIVIHQGKIAEMKTGEGKTLVEVAPVYLNALTGKGVHVITVNDYLAERDKELMRPVYESLDMTVGVIISNQDPSIRKEQYKCDITYGTNSEFGFDYLRDNMVPDLSHKVQRELNFAIVDEVDSILIDEARTPLIIAGDGDEDLKL